jgi:hypothetical protein
LPEHQWRRDRAAARSGAHPAFDARIDNAMLLLQVDFGA